MPDPPPSPSKYKITFTFTQKSFVNTVITLFTFAPEQIGSLWFADITTMVRSVPWVWLSSESGSQVKLLPDWANGPEPSLALTERSSEEESRTQGTGPSCGTTEKKTQKTIFKCIFKYILLWNRTKHFFYLHNQCFLSGITNQKMESFIPAWWSGTLTNLRT